ncbi:MAG: hypothetical protein P8Z41_15095 [Anaerolineales bacterium]
MKKTIRRISPWLGIVLLLSLLLLLLDLRSNTLSGWLAYLVMCSVLALVVAVVGRIVFRQGVPGNVMRAFLIALGLRLVIGVTLFHTLPQFGYDEKPQNAGYVFADAYRRDVDSFQLARSDEPLSSAFTNPSGDDQYGGFKFLNALIYRYLSPDVRRPFLIMLMCAVISALSIFPMWGFAQAAFGSRAAGVAVWVMVLFPDAVLLGASQMREPLISFALSFALYGYAKVREDGLKEGLLLILLSVLFILPISPPYTFVILGIIGLLWIFDGRVSVLRARWLLAALAGIIALSLFFIIRSWTQIEGFSRTGFMVIVQWIKSLTANDKLMIIADQSDWTRHLFRSTPEWAHYPVFVFYGIFRPFLPAAIIDSGAPLWRIIALWRGLGWFSLLPFLLYAPFAAVRHTGWRSLPTGLSLLTWITILISSYRGAGDQWDNPRYRTAFIALQAVLVGWAWVTSREKKGRWLPRMAILVLSVTVLFTLWYAFRGRLLPVFTPMHMIASMAAFIVLFFLFHLVRDFYRSRKVTT